MALFSLLACRLLDALDVPAPQALDLATELEVAGNRRIIEQTKTIDHGNRLARPAHHLFRRQLAVGFMRYGQDQRVDAL